MAAGQYPDSGVSSREIYGFRPRDAVALALARRHARRVSWQPAEEGVGELRSCPGLETVVVPKVHDIGGFEVRRLLPALPRRAVGPFVFWDQMGPATLAPGRGIDVRPHPHIGLATITYLFAGTILHRDSLGSVQPIEPGAVNWMTAGRGIVHSERTPPELRPPGSPLAGIQAWVALPRSHEECDPAFVHHPAATLPVHRDEGVAVRVLVGSLLGLTSPVTPASPTFYADAELTAGARLVLPADYPERAVHVASGSITVAGERFDAGRLLVFRGRDAIPITTDAPARVLLLGGEPLDGPRHLWWNFVSSSPARIERAKADWQAERFAPVPGETERIPLPAR
jgi:redox-sensitive bicupin YhaK (pirin superfamily)